MDRSAARQQDRMMTPRQHLRRFADVGLGIFDLDLGKGRIGHRRVANFLAHQILRQEDRRRSRSAHPHRHERPIDHAADLIVRHDGAAELGARLEDSVEIDFVIVAAFLMDAVGVDLTGEQQDRNGIGPSLGDAGERVGRAGTGRGADNARLPGGPSEAVRHECAGLFVAGENRANSSVADDRVVKGSAMRPRHPEYDSDAVMEQPFD